MTGPGRLPAPALAWLVEDHRTESCPADATYAASVLESILEQECEDVLHAASQGRWTKANTYSYDAARKSVEALLLAEGWRIRAVAGAHAAAVDLVALVLDNVRLVNLIREAMGRDPAEYVLPTEENLAARRDSGGR